MLFRSVIILLVSIVMLGSQAFALNTIKGKPRHVPGEIVVKFVPGTTAESKGEIMRRFGLAHKQESLKFGMFTVVTHAMPDAVLETLKREGSILYAERNAYAYALVNDPYFGYQWHMESINAEGAWSQVTNPGAGTVVAVVDTGVRQSLEDLNETLFVPGYDFINGDNDPNDDNNHGSHVAGTIAQSTNNGIGVTGVAYKAAIMPVKVLDRRGSGSYTAIANGIYYATDNGADVINMSLGGSANLNVLRDACEYAAANDVVIVAAAGNDATDSPFYPAAYPVCISVSATTLDDALAGYSNYGSTIDIAAPGGDSADRNGDGYVDMVLQNTFSRKNEGYYFFQGTSMASPHVAGVAALVRGARPNLTAAEVRDILLGTATNMGQPYLFGAGLLNASEALAVALDVSPPTNTAPMVNLGDDRTIVLGDGLYLDAAVVDDGLVNNTLGYLWEKVEGDGVVTFTPNEEKATQMSFTQAGTYTVRLTADDGEFTGSDQVVVTVTETETEEGGGTLSVNAGAGTSVSLASGGTVNLSGIVSGQDTVTAINWTKGKGPGKVTIHALNSLSTAVTFSRKGTFTMNLTVSDLDETVTDSVVVTVTNN
jgi:serine protease